MPWNWTDGPYPGPNTYPGTDVYPSFPAPQEIVPDLLTSTVTFHEPTVAYEDARTPLAPAGASTRQSAGSPGASTRVLVGTPGSGSGK